jgi:hypothetical protein
VLLPGALALLGVGFVLGFDFDGVGDILGGGP